MKTKAFTLFETLIYMALFGVLMSSALIAVYDLQRSAEYNRTGIAIQEEGTFINRKLNWMLMGATAVVISNPYTIAITRNDLGSQSPLHFSIHDNRAYLRRSGNIEVPLTGDEFLVTNMSIQVVPPEAQLPTRIRITYAVNQVPFVYETYLYF